MRRVGLKCVIAQHACRDESRGSQHPVQCAEIEVEVITAELRLRTRRAELDSALLERALWLADHIRSIAEPQLTSLLWPPAAEATMAADELEATRLLLDELSALADGVATPGEHLRSIKAVVPGRALPLTWAEGCGLPLGPGQ